MSIERKSTKIKCTLSYLFKSQYYKIPVALSLVFLLVAATLVALGKHYWANQIALYSFYLLVAGFSLLIYIRQTKKLVM